LVDMFWRNSKPFKKLIFHVGKKQALLIVYIMGMWKVKIVLK